MKARLVLIAAAGVLLGGLALAPPAEAGHLGWSFGAGFHVGGLHFQVGFSPVGYGGYPGPYFLTTGRLHYPGHGCRGACFRRGAAIYHHASCPLLSFHLRGFGYGPDHFVRNYSPYRGYGRSYGRYPNRSYGHYYRDGYRDRFRSHRGRYDRGRHSHGYRDGRHYRHDRRRGRDYRHDRDRDRDRRRHYRDDRRRGGRDGDRDRAQRRRGARRTRPPG